MVESDKLKLLHTQELWQHLHPKEQQAVRAAAGFLSFQNLRRLAAALLDLRCWEINFQALLPTENEKFELFFKRYEQLKRQPLPAKKQEFQQQTTIEHTHYPPVILGRCPVASAKTRCCNLYTLDAAQGCGFACAYCAIPGFYGGQGKVKLPLNLAQRLAALKLDKNKLWHIGTGQSSDSLLYAGANGAAEALVQFAASNPHVILELKSKSDAIAPFLGKPLPANMIFTWSLNPQEAVAAWEGQTASLEKRLQAAKTIGRHALIGFHLHPIIPFEGWQSAYRQLAQRLADEFDPKNIAMASMGTLTFSKAAIKRLRLSGQKNNILKLPLEEAAGKWSLPLSLKQEMFATVWAPLKAAGWAHETFFYLCMEDISLWQPLFGFSYADNGHFERAMLAAYHKKITAFSNKKLKKLAEPKE